MLLINLMFVAPLLCGLAGLALFYSLWRSSKVVELDPQHVEKLFGPPLPRQSWDGMERRSGIDRRSGSDRRREGERRTSG
jgi:hypothetical protein